MSRNETSSSVSQSQQHEDQSIGQFIVKSEIGKGSFAVVHKGYRLRDSHSNGDRDGDSGRRDSGNRDRDPQAGGSNLDDRNPSSLSPNLRYPVAIKIVTRKKLTPKLLDNLEGEIAILRAISHPNIVELKDCLKTDSHIYLVMEFCSAGDLSLFIKKRGSLPSNSDPIYNSQNLPSSLSSSSSSSSQLLTNSQLLEPIQDYLHPEDGGLNEVVTRSFLSQLASALEFMREKNIVHRDIKPQNLLLQPPDRKWIELGNERNIPQMKVADFGFARSLPAASLAETLCGSPLYMAPEILRYEKYDAKADLWSVGAVLYEMCVGKPPFRAANHVELLKKIERGEDRIKFPDERSAGSLQREADRRAKDGEKPLPHPHTVSEDLKSLIRLLLKRKPVERGSFEELFKGEICKGFKEGTRTRLEERERRRKAFEEGKDKGEKVENQGFGKSDSVDITNLNTQQSQGQGENRNSSQDSIPISHSPTPKSPSSPITLRTFTSKYVVGGGGTNRSHSRGSSSATDPVGQIKRNPSGSGGSQRSGNERNTSSPSSLDDPALLTPSSSITNLEAAAVPAIVSQTNLQGLSPADEDSFLGKEYVMIDKGNVEVNALADELAFKHPTSHSSNPRSPPSALVRRPSRLRSGVSIQSSNAGATSTSSNNNPNLSSSPSNTFQSNTVGGNQGLGTLSSSPLASLPIRTPTGTTPPTPSNAPFALPIGSRPSGFNRRTSLSSSGSPSPRLTSQSLAGVGNTTPPLSSGEELSNNVIASGGAGIANPSRGFSISPNNTGGTGTISLSSSPSYNNAISSSSSTNPASSALARAISMASVRLFGVPSGMSLRSAASLVRTRGNRRSTLIRSGEHPDSQEANLLIMLEDLGQKSWVLSECADAKLSNHFANGPHQIGGGSLTDLEGSSSNNFGGNSSSSLAGNRNLVSNVNRRTASNSSSVLSNGNSNGNGNGVGPEAENAAAEAYVLYVKSLSFLQRGIQATKLFTESRSRPGISPTVSADVSDLVQWLRARFNETFEKATFAGGKFGEQLSETAQDLEKLIYDRALEIAKRAAHDELENNREGNGWDPNNCMLAYETALWMLEGLLDPGEDGRPLPESEVGQVRQFIVSIEKRLEGLRRKTGSPL